MTSRALVDELSSDAPRLVSLLKRAVRRRGGLAFVEGATWGLLLGLTGALVLKVYEKLFWPGWDATTSWSWIGASVGGAVLLGAIVAWLFRPKDPLRAALAIEGEYALKERLSSIVFLRKSREHVDPDAAAALARDGDEYATRVDLRRALPFRRPRAGIPAACMAVAFAIAVFLPQYDVLGSEEDRQDIAKEEKRVEEARKRQDKRIKKLQEKAKKDKVSPKTQKLLNKMSHRPPERKNSEKRRTAKGEVKRRELADMDNLRKEAKALRNRAEMKQLDKFLNKVQAAGQKMQSQEAKQLAKALQQGDLSQASEALKKLAKKIADEKKKGGPKSEELKKLEEDLAKLMKKMDGAPSLAKLAESLGDMSNMSGTELSEALSQAASDMSELERLMRERDILDSALQDIEMTQDELAQLPTEWEEPCELCQAGGT